MEISITYETIGFNSGVKLKIITNYIDKNIVKNKLTSILDEMKENYKIIEIFNDDCFNILNSNIGGNNIKIFLTGSLYVIFENKNIDFDDVLGYFFKEKLKGEI